MNSSDDDEPVEDIVDIEYRGRGRPRLPPDQKRREKVVISVTAQEKKDMIHAGADADGGPLSVQDWARKILIAASRKATP